MARPQKPLDEHLMLKKYLDGATSREIAKEFGVTQQTVMNRLYKYLEVKVGFSVQVEKTLKK